MDRPSATQSLVPSSSTTAAVGRVDALNLALDLGRPRAGHGENEQDRDGDRKNTPHDALPQSARHCTSRRDRSKFFDDVGRAYVYGMIGSWRPNPEAFGF